MASKTEAELWAETADLRLAEASEEGLTGIGCAVLALTEKLAEFAPVAERLAVALERIAATLESARDELDGGA